MKVAVLFTVQGSTSGVRIVAAISPSSPVVGEALFQDMAERDYATSTIGRTWNYLNPGVSAIVMV